MKKLLVLMLVAVALGALGGERRPAAESADAPEPKFGAPAPVLVELFTSEGCSSCPPADAVLSRLEKTQPVEGALVVPLALHVDYWNSLGWPDPFSAPEFSTRQGEYAAAYGKSDVYTPQMIVDGVKEFPGGHGAAAVEAIARAAREPKAPVQITRAAQTGGEARLSVRIERLPQATEGDRMFVLLAVTESDLANQVRRGENAGRRLTHAGVVRRLTTLGRVADGGTFTAEATVAPEKSWRRENLRVVVFAQEAGSRRVLAVGSFKLFE